MYPARLNTNADTPLYLSIKTPSTTEASYRSAAPLLRLLSGGRKHDITAMGWMLDNVYPPESPQNLYNTWAGFEQEEGGGGVEAGSGRTGGEQA